jgi:lipopolysaccharide transport system ATP-binding protein
MSNIVISVENLSKQYQLGLIGGKTLRDDLSRWWARARGKPDPLLKIGQSANGDGERIWALRDINFEVRQGEVVGIIGKNGAGKSTLLKILSRITAPTSGQVKVKGRIASLLEVGTGFHPELTGRENIYLNGSILGMRRAEIDRKLDEIVDFSGVEKFIDTPVKRYSSGMYVRLAFAVAAHLEPEILVVDEVLAVGDAEFQKKCLGKMGEVAREGRTVLFVSHNMDMIRGLCERSILLNHGVIQVDGFSDEIIDLYIQQIYDKTGDCRTRFEVGEMDDLPIQILKGRVLNQQGEEQCRFDAFDPIIIEIEYVVRRTIKGANIHFELQKGGTPLFSSFDTDHHPENLDNRTAGFFVSHIQLPCPLLKPDRYTVSMLPGITNVEALQILRHVLSFEVELISRPSTFLSYASKRPGMIVADLNWKTNRVLDY